MLITFEGIDGSGKTTQIRLLKEFLEANGRSVHLFREPGGTDIGEEVRSFLLDESFNLEQMTQMILFLSSRSELIRKVVKPLLESGEIVILDRYIASTIAYQGYAQRLGINNAWYMCKLATGNILPDIEIYLNISPMKAFKRFNESKGVDRYETIDFLKRASQGYDTWYKLQCPYPHTVIDCEDKSIQEVSSIILKSIWSTNKV